MRQSAIALNADHLAREPGENSRLIAGASPHFENTVVRLDRQLLSHVGNHVGLADGLAAGNR